MAAAENSPETPVIIQSAALLSLIAASLSFVNNSAGQLAHADIQKYLNLIQETNQTAFRVIQEMPSLDPGLRSQLAVFMREAREISEITQMLAAMSTEGNRFF